MIKTSDGKQVYRHYGHKAFDSNLFIPISNPKKVRVPSTVSNEISRMLNVTIPKPNGGLWASPVRARYKWDDWNETNEFKDCDINNMFEFTIKTGTKILLIRNQNDIDGIRKELSIDDIHSLYGYPIPDFELLKKRRIAAIEVKINMFTERAMPCWDCDSIVILDENIIVSR